MTSMTVRAHLHMTQQPGSHVEQVLATRAPCTRRLYELFIRGKLYVPTIRAVSGRGELGVGPYECECCGELRGLHSP